VTAVASPQARASLFVLALGLATVLGAWGFQVFGGYLPCPLCLQQRIPYYVGLPIVGAGLIAALSGAPSRLTRALLGVAALVFAWNVWLGTYHAGAEWGLWAGPSDCGPGGAQSTLTAEDLLKQLQDIRIVSCTDVQWRFPAGWGLSFAGWNVVVSTLLVLGCLWGAIAPTSCLKAQRLE
jgi:disulfide bond formation protein DsbB